MGQTDEAQVSLTRKKKIALHKWLVAHVLCCSTWRALDCSLWFKWLSIIQGVKGKELQRVFFTVSRVCGSNTHTAWKSMNRYILYIHTHMHTRAYSIHTHTRLVPRRLKLSSKEAGCQKKLTKLGNWWAAFSNVLCVFVYAGKRVCEHA